MKKKEKQQLHAQSLADLTKKATEIEKKLKEAIRDRVAKPTKDVHAIKKMREELAIVKTLARQKELAHE